MQRKNKEKKCKCVNFLGEKTLTEVCCNFFLDNTIMLKIWQMKENLGSMLHSEMRIIKVVSIKWC